MHQVGEHSGPLAGQKLLPGTIGFAPLAATRIKIDARNLNSARFVALYYFNQQDQRFAASCEVQGISLHVMSLLLDADVLYDYFITQKA